MFLSYPAEEHVALGVQVRPVSLRLIQVLCCDFFSIERQLFC